MKKKLFFAVVAIGLLASCVDNEYVGEVTPNPNPGNGTESAIVFSSGTKALTRADHIDGDAAGLLNNNFVFGGTKTTSYTTVFNNYQANYVANTANTTQSNSNDWEYVSYTNLPGGVGTNVGVTSYATSSTNNTGVSQSIKYWDYSTSQYDFAAYSLGKGNTTTTTGDNPTSTTTYATASAIAMTNVGSNDAVFTLTGSVDELKSCYISDLVTAYNQNSVSDYGNVVTFSFRSLATKIRIAFYETIPGYSVKDILFYSLSKSDEGASPADPTTTPTLFTSPVALPSGSGTMKVTYPTTGWTNSGRASGGTKATDYNKAHVSFEQASGTTPASTLTFEAIGNYATSAEGQILANTNGYIGRASNDASYAGGLVSSAGKYYTIMPNESGANLQLRIKYTLVSTDNSNETITVDNATAVVPKELAQWNPNYAYTYIFKISDMTNGTTGIDQETGKPTMGLTPITLNAVVVDSEDGIQETITTVSEPSITTYTKGKVVTAKDEYVSGNVIYVIVNNGTNNVTLTPGTNANLYTVTLTKSSDEDAAGVASQPISEESVENALIHGTKDNESNPTTWTVKDANKWNLVVTKSNLLAATNNIAASDSPTGNQIDVVGAKFTAGTAGTVYVFEYKKDAQNEQAAVLYADAAEYNAAKGTSLSNEEFDALSAEEKIKTPAVAASAAAKAYKIIKIQKSN